mgnify:FL=1|jgi:hypothetical protein
MIGRRNRLKKKAQRRRRSSILKKSSSMEVVPLDDTITLNSWMEDNYTDHYFLFDSLNVVPATHNSGAVFSKKIKNCIPWRWSKCQYLTITDQLNNGIRCLDLRLKLVRDSSNNSHYQIVHYFESTYSFMDIMNEVNAFLKENPKETVFIMMKPDWNTRKNWEFNDLDIMWKKIRDLDFVFKKNDSYEGVEKLLLHQLRFKHVRGKAIIMPNGHFYKTYKNIATTDKVNTGLDIDCIHDVKIVYPNFINRCENWDIGTINAAKIHIETFLKNNIVNKQKMVNTQGNSDDDNQVIDIKWFETNVFPLIETNVLLWKGCLPPCISCKFMHPYLKQNCSKQSSSSNSDICYVKKLGFVLLDYADPTLIRSLLSNNKCVHDYVNDM